MKSVSRVFAAAAGFLLGSATVVTAGVVMSETAVSSGAIDNSVRHRTIYVQGNKQKVDTDNVQTITDLDKHMIYVIDKEKKNYVEVPLASLNDLFSGGGGSADAAIDLTRTGSKQVIAEHRCEEYRGRQGNAQVQITVSACVSSSAPGAKEIARFDRAMIAQMRGLKPESSASTGVVLEKKSVVSLRLPDPSQPGYKTTSLVTSTRVNGIQVKQLAAQTFTPPKGFSKVQNQPPQELPDELESAALAPWRTESQLSAIPRVKI
ncbi:MAG TPA: hypothetical protein VKB84_08795 [Candidatus Binataceae bacterium]|nr:hypothetical protein [Candidatus Binataceae bacterium]